MVQVMHVFSLFYENNEKLSKFTKKGQVLHAQKVACLLACIQMTLPNKGMCGEGDVGLVMRTLSICCCVVEGKTPTTTWRLAKITP